MNQPPRGSGTGDRCQGCEDAPVGQHTGPHDWEDQEGERDDKYCVHCGRHPTAFQEVQAQRERIEELTVGATELTLVADALAARIEELESVLRSVNRNLTKYMRENATPIEVSIAAGIARAVLNQNPPNPRSEG